MSEGEGFDAEAHRANVYTRKLLMICGEANGPPYDRTLHRLSRMLRKSPDGELPPEVSAFCDQAIENLDTVAERYQGRRLKKHEAPLLAHIVEQRAAFELMRGDLEEFLYGAETEGDSTGADV